MKRPYLKSLGLIVILLTLGLIIASIQSSKKYKFGTKAEKLHVQLLEGEHYIAPESAMELITKKDDKYIFVDIRNPREFDNFHLEGAVNVPLQRVLDDIYIPYLENDKIKVLYSNESIDADQVRLLLTQYGYDNLYVLQGGVDYWKENMISKNVFKSVGEYNDEKLKFDIDKIKSSE